MQTEFSLEAAIEGLSKALQADPKNAEIHCKLAIALAEQGNSSAAIESYQAAINIEPRHIPALNNLGSIYRSLGRTEEAVSVFEQVVKFALGDVIGTACVFIMLAIMLKPILASNKKKPRN